MFRFLTAVLTMALFILAPAVARADNTHGAPGSNGTYGVGNAYVTVCDSSVSINTSTSGVSSAALINGVSGKQIRVCAIGFAGNGSVTVSLPWSTATSCTSPTYTGMPFGSGGVPLPQAGFAFAMGYGVGELFHVPAGDSLCINLSAAVAVTGIITYTVF